MKISKMISTPEGEWTRRIMVMPKDLQELASMISKRDKISMREAEELIAVCSLDMQTAFYNGDLGLAEQILAGDLQLEPDYLTLFIN